MRESEAKLQAAKEIGGDWTDPNVQKRRRERTEEILNIPYAEQAEESNRSWIRQYVKDLYKQLEESKNHVSRIQRRIEINENKYPWLKEKS